jgi:hypothetical protein
MSNLSDPAKPWEKDPTWIKLRDEFDMFDDILDEKNPMKFAETYLRLQTVQLSHARSIKPDLPSILPYEIVIESMSYMESLGPDTDLYSLYAFECAIIGTVSTGVQIMALARHQWWNLARNVRAEMGPQCCHMH